jgi:hypothetical protein
MLTGLVVASSNTKPQNGQPTKSGPREKSPTRNIFEERWQRRQGE